MGTMARLAGPMRPNFLVLTPICVLLGAAVAFFETGALPAVDLALALVGAVLAHSSVNLLNEFEDFRSGLDAMTERTPFSGGSGILPAHPELAEYTRVSGQGALLGTSAVGIYFLADQGPALLPLGLLGVLVVAAYSTWIVRHPLICLIAPGLGFGPLMVGGSALVLGAGYSATAFLVSLCPFFLVSGLLLLNQFPDVEPDRHVGRRNIPIVWGRPAAARLFAILVVAAFVPIVAGIGVGRLPLHAAIGLVPLAAAPRLVNGVLNNPDEIPALVPLMGLNVMVVLATPALLAVGIFWGSGSAP